MLLMMVILGPTASGKTGYSIRHAKTLKEQGMKPEIINADSRQLYKYLDIGTAKITEEEMEGIPHHLISVLDPSEPLTIARYKEMAMKTIDEIHARGGLPILVGGSMLYISAIIDGLEPVNSDKKLRERLNAEYDKDGGVALFERLKEVDPESASGIPKENKVYLVRALEIFEATGEPKSLQKKKSDCPFDVSIIGIDVPVDVLNERIAKRVDEMFAKGWVEEVRQLIEKGYSEKDPAMESHGYREIISWIKNPVMSIEELKATIATKSRQYAKRQRTWWRGDERILWEKI